MSANLEKYLKEFFELHTNEKLWILFHIFKVRKVWEVSQRALQIANEHIKDPDMDGDHAGGMVDAFRHCLWMALLTNYFNERLARSLGKTHEKANKKDFKQKKLEEKYLPDYISCQMDLLNNEIGIKIGKKFKGKNDKEFVEIVKKAVLNGECWKIKKDQKGNFLNAYNEIIPENEWKGKWFTEKILVPTDFFVKK